MNDVYADLEKRMRLRGIPGVSIRLVQGDGLLFACDLGVASLSANQLLTPLHRFRVGCLTKPIVAQSVLELRARGELELHDNVSRFMPELDSNCSLHYVTVEQLLCHTSGLARGDYHASAVSNEQLLARVLQSPLHCKPGGSYKYSNWGYFLLGEIVRRIVGCTPEEHVHQTVFLPLEMKHSTFGSGERGATGLDCLATGYWKGWRFGASDLGMASTPCPHVPLASCAAGVVSTADDYAKWLMAVTVGAKKGIAPVIATEMLTLRQDKPGRKYATCGLFAERIGEDVFYYFPGTGSGFSGFLFLLPRQQVGGVALSNHLTCNSELREMLFQVYRRAAKVDRWVPFGRTEATFAATLADVEGQRWRLFDVDDDRALLVGNGQKVELYRHSAKAYFVLSGGSRKHMLRTNGKRGRAAKASWGDKVLRASPRRARRGGASGETPGGQVGPMDGSTSWCRLAGIYWYAPFGLVEVILREGRPYLNYGVVYETALDHLSELRFRQRSGPCRLEVIEFRRSTGGGAVAEFVTNGMVFQRLR